MKKKILAIILSSILALSLPTAMIAEAYDILPVDVGNYHRYNNKKKVPHQEAGQGHLREVVQGHLREVVQGVDQVRLQKTVNLIRLQAEATAIILAVFQKAQNLLLTFLIQKIL